MVPRETVSFVFPRVLMFPETSSRETSELGPCIKCFVIYLDFHIAKPNKQGQRRGNNYAIVSRSGYIWIWSEARDQESTNYNAYFVEWKSSYITIGFIVFERLKPWWNPKHEFLKLLLQQRKLISTIIWIIRFLNSTIISETLNVLDHQKNVHDVHDPIT